MTAVATNGMLARTHTESVTDERLFAGPFEGRIRVSPDRARRWLDTRNTRNRMVVKSNVRKIVESIEAGHWRDDHPNALLFDREGVLLDGQHRLMAVCESGIPVTMKVVTGCDPTLRQFIDTGRHRQLHDRVTVDEDKFVNRNAVAICCYLGSKTTSTAYNLETFARVFGENKDAVLFAARWMSQRPILKRVCNGPVAAAIAKMYNVSPEMAARFANSIRQADGPSQPGRILRDWVLSRTNGSFGGGQGWDIHERALNACYAELCGREVKQLKRLEAIPDYDTAA